MLVGGRSKPRAHDYLDELAPRTSARDKLKTLGRCALGWLVGYLISAVSSILFFQIGHIAPHAAASTGLIWATAIYGILFAIVGAIVGANFSRANALGIGAALAATIAGVALWSWTETPEAPHWTQAIAIFLMAPAAQFGALFRRSPD
jgi:VIT1/CCC1 family predicted Fe2+/Mn2+ transporter